MNDFFGHWRPPQSNLSDIPEGSIGFIYKITNNLTNRKYIGKKLLKFKVTRKPLKGRKNKRRSTKDSDWKTYTGSCAQLNNDIATNGKDNFSFEILIWCNNKTDLNYEEIKQIILANALYDKDYYNEYVGGRVRVRK